MLGEPERKKQGGLYEYQYREAPAQSTAQAEALFHRGHSDYFAMKKCGSDRFQLRGVNYRPAEHDGSVKRDVPAELGILQQNNRRYAGDDPYGTGRHHTGCYTGDPGVALSARNLASSGWIYHPVRLLLNLIRTIPDLLLAAIFVAIFGLGPLPVIFALTVFSLGMIAKLAYEALETIDKGPLEALILPGRARCRYCGSQYCCRFCPASCPIRYTGSRLMSARPPFLV